MEYNILICDDDRDIVEALRIYLSAEGYRIFPAYTGQEAIDILRRETIHLVLMDIMMPVLDGISATVRLRETHNIPVILLTAKSEDTDKVLGLTIGADDCSVSCTRATVSGNSMQLEAVSRADLQRSAQTLVWMWNNRRENRDVS